MSAPQGIEIAPASDFCGFKEPIPSPASIFSKILLFRNLGSGNKVAEFIHSSGCRPRRALIFGEDQAITHRSCLILRDVHLRRLCESYTPENIENVPSAQADSIQRFPVSRYYSSVQPFYESRGIMRGAPQGIEIAPASDFDRFRSLNRSPASIFSKIWLFRNFGTSTKLLAHSQFGL